MRKIKFSFAVTIVAVLILAGGVLAAGDFIRDTEFTHDGPMGPYDFEEWKIVDMGSLETGELVPILVNPNHQESSVKAAVLMIELSLGVVTAYAYLVIEDGVAEVKCLAYEGELHYSYEDVSEETRRGLKAALMEVYKNYLNRGKGLPEPTKGSLPWV
jgi:hypothetical protein